MTSAVIDYPQWLASLDDDAFDAVADAAERVVTIHQALASDGLSLLGELFRDRAQGPIDAWEHFPADDCRDPGSGAMYYYHAHDPADWDRDEHGHFHLFVRPQEGGEFHHLMALSVTAQGVPNGLFATNRWVTDEVMRPAGRMLQWLDEGWEINRARPSWLVAQWLTAMVALLRPHAEALLRRRDERLEWNGAGEPQGEILADRTTHILSDAPLDLMAMLEAIQAEARTRFL